MNSQIISNTLLLARLEKLEAGVVELEGRMAAGTATVDDRAELVRMQAEADFYLETLEELGALEPREDYAASTSCS